MEDNNNKTVWNEPFFKYRSVNKCYSTAVSFISDRFWKIIRLAAPVILLASLLMTTFFYVLCDAGLQLSMGSSMWFVVLSVLFSFFILSMLLAFIFRCISVNIDGLNIYSISYKYIYNKIYCSNFLKALVVLLINFVIVAIISVITYFVLSLIVDNEVSNIPVGKVDLLPMIIIFVATCIFVALTIPLYASLNKLMLDNNGYKDAILRGYTMGWKRWGRIFALDLLVTITITVLVVFVMSPAYVISLMQHSATLSRLQGDAVDIPSYFPVITVAILFLASVFISILTFMKYLPQAYLYASIKVEEQQIDNITNK